MRVRTKLALWWLDWRTRKQLAVAPMNRARRRATARKLAVRTGGDVKSIYRALRRRER